MQIKAIGDREGWCAVVCSRGEFELVEFWLENRFLIEFLTPTQAAQYLAFTSQPALVERVFGTPLERDRELVSPV